MIITIKGAETFDKQKRNGSRKRKNRAILLQ